jgi:putative membrane protein
MSWTIAQLAVFLIGLLHVFFMLGELLPWNRPLIMTLVLKKWRRPLDLGTNENYFVSAVVHNAGIYNGIVASGLFAAFWLGPSAFLIQVALLTGGIVAGVFGAATLTPRTIVQALLGAIALGVVLWFRP